MILKCSFQNCLEYTVADFEKSLRKSPDKLYYESDAGLQLNLRPKAKLSRDRGTT